MRIIQDGDISTTGEVIITGTGSPDPITGLPTPTGPVLSKRFATVSWTHTEPQPAGALQGFEVILYLGDDPNNTSAYVITPALCKTTDRSFQTLLELRSQQTIKAAVRALYPDGYSSAWTAAPVGATFIPTTQAYGTNGSQKFPDGTIMQWMRSAIITGQQEARVDFPVPFPHACFCVQITTENIDHDSRNDAIFQLVGQPDAKGCTVFRQSPNAESDPKSNRAHVTAWGY